MTGSSNIQPKMMQQATISKTNPHSVRQQQALLLHGKNTQQNTPIIIQRDTTGPQITSVQGMVK